MTTIKVAIVGGSSESGQSIVNALLETFTPKYVSYQSRVRMYPLTRLCIGSNSYSTPQSIRKAVNTKLQERGVKLFLHTWEAHLRKWSNCSLVSM